MKSTLLIISIVFCFFNTINSQVQRKVDMQNTRDGENIEYCFTHKKMQALLQNQDFLTQFNLEKFEQYTLVLRPNNSKESYTVFIGNLLQQNTS